MYNEIVKKTTEDNEYSGLSIIDGLKQKLFEQ